MRVPDHRAGDRENGMKGRTTHMKIIVTAMIALAVLIVFGSFFLAKLSMGIRRQSLEQAWKWQEEHYDLSWYGALEKEEYTVNSFDGYVLHVQHLVNPKAEGRYVVISHGYTDNRYGALKYAKIYLDLGFHVITYDLRGHGENEKTYCTYSVREGEDLSEILRDCRERYPDIRVLGIHGESLGAASSVACLKYKPEIGFAVSDCAFSDIEEVLKYGGGKAPKPEFLLNMVSLADKVWYGYFLHEMRPIDSLKGNKIPMLFLHGENDSIIPPEHSRKLSSATEGYHELYLIPGAGHAESVLTAPEQYREYVETFLKTIGAI